MTVNFESMSVRQKYVFYILGITLVTICTIIVIILQSKSTSRLNNSGAVVRTFKSARLGITFQYASSDLGKEINVNEVDNTVYVYPAGTMREEGQYVKIFQKSTTMTLSEAIKQDFLKDTNQTDCFVQTGTDLNGTEPEHGLAAVIAFPVSETADDAWLKNAEKCPPGYRAGNGISYFWTSDDYAERYVYFSIGQYYIPVNSVGSSWHTTVGFIPIS